MARCDATALFDLLEKRSTRLRATVEIWTEQIGKEMARRAASVEAAAGLLPIVAQDIQSDRRREVTSHVLADFGHHLRL